MSETVTDNAVYTAAWKADRNHNGIADEDENKFSVTYTDGVDNEEVFPDQSYNDLLSDDHTPAFRGESDTAATPTREGYVFAGWSPEVSETVTGNAVYTATWEKEKPQPTGDDAPAAAAAVSAALAAGAIIVFTLRRRKIHGTK